MEVPHAPIIVLRQRDDAVYAFFTKDEAVGYLSENTNLEPKFVSVDWDFFDALGRRLSPAVGSDGEIEDLSVASDERHAGHVRERVKRRSQHARHMLEKHREAFERVDESPLTLADQDIPFELFAWRFASVVRPEGSPSDPVLKFGPDHSAGWWHNTFGH